jgi:hypothetical protein
MQSFENNVILFFSRFIYLGGVVNYTAEVTFPGTEHRITIHQRFFGLNSFDQLVMDATVQGTTPQVPLPHTRFTLPNDQQQYTISKGTY